MAAILSGCRLSTDEPTPSPSPDRIGQPTLPSATASPSPTATATASPTVTATATPDGIFQPPFDSPLATEPPPSATPQPTATPTPRPTPFPAGPPTKLGLFVAWYEPQIMDLIATRNVALLKTLELDPAFLADVRARSPQTIIVGRVELGQVDLTRADVGAEARRAAEAVLPLALEDLPGEMTGFDTVLSMGVLYHRRSPQDHLRVLRRLLRPGGELVVETLVIGGADGDVLVPAGRYARMRNVWTVPGLATLESWIADCGFHAVRVVDVTITTTAEQRSTDWMRFESLAQALDPKDPGRTVEGLPAPRRAVVLATG